MKGVEEGKFYRESNCGGMARISKRKERRREI